MAHVAIRYGRIQKTRSRLLTAQCGGEGMIIDTIDKKELELHTSAPSVELANDAARNARCKGCDHMQLVYMNTPGLPMRYACKDLGFRLCVDICDDACPRI